MATITMEMPWYSLTCGCSRSMFMDEDGHFAHEFYREKKVRSKRGVVRWIMEKITSSHLIPQV